MIVGISLIELEPRPTSTSTINPFPDPPEVGKTPLEYPEPYGRLTISPLKLDVCNVLTTPTLDVGPSIITFGGVP